MLSDCSVLMMSLCVMLVIWLQEEREGRDEPQNRGGPDKDATRSVTGLVCSWVYLRSLMDSVPLKSLRISSRTQDQ